MPKSIVSICIFHGLLLTSLTAAAQTGAPYFNVMNSPYNATCDGNPAHDDTGAIQHAINDAKAQGGGAVLIPITPGACIIQTSLNLDRSSGISLTGPPGGNTGLGSPTSLLLFTGTPSSLVSMRSTAGVSIKNLTLQYNNPGFGGTFIDLSHAPAAPPAFPAEGPDSDMDYIADCTIQGTGSFNASTQVWTVAAGNANPLISLDKAINITIERNIFQWSINGIIGPATSGSYANAIRIRDNSFSGYNTNSISGNMILNMGTGWVIEGNTFEMTGASTFFPIPINGNTVGCSGCQISGNWIGDTSQPFSNGMIVGNFIGTVISGNYISGLFSSAAVGISVSGSSNGVSITGNDFSQLNVGVYYSSNGASNISISGNNYDRVSNPSMGIPSSGIVSQNANTRVFGNLQKSSGSFTIDHPLDPENKYLSHSFVESPDMMNIYNGVATLDARGQALVKLPSYFESLNQDFRYQLTPIGAFAPVYVAEKIKENSFKIAGGKLGMEISWQVTGIRHDAYANAHRIVVEENKPTDPKR